MKTSVYSLFSFMVMTCMVPHMALAQPQSDTIISPLYFGFDFWNIDRQFWDAVYQQMAEDSLPFALVGTDAINWQKVEPDPPLHGVHTYHWGATDTLFWITQQAGKKVDLGIRPLSNWGTVLPADSMDDWAVDMSALLPDSLSDTSWGMTARQAWKEFVYHLAERYDGDLIEKPQNLPIDSDMIKTLMIGNEPEAPGHFFADTADLLHDPGGNVEKLNELFDLIYDTAKYANPDIIIVRGKSNPGHIFDDLPDTGTVYFRRTALFDSLRKDFGYGATHYDYFAINYNDHYTSLLGYVNWLKINMQAYGIEKPFLVGDARTTLFPRDNFYLDDSMLIPKNIMPQIYDSSIVHLPDTSHPLYMALKGQWRKDKVMQSIRKLAISAAANQYQVSLQPVYVPSGYNQGNRTYMWMYGGFFDPLIYEQSGDLALAREPLYWSAKLFANTVMGCGKQAQMLNAGNHIYAVQYDKPTGDDPIIAWHEDHFLMDTTTNLLQRNQEMLADLSGFFPTQYVRIRYFYNAVDSFGLPVSVPDTIVSAQSVPLDEFPVILLPSVNPYAFSPPAASQDVRIYPNPSKGVIHIDSRGERILGLELLTLNGEMLGSWNGQAAGGIIKLEPELPDGLYLLHVRTKRLSFTGKITLMRNGY